MSQILKFGCMPDVSFCPVQAFTQKNPFSFPTGKVVSRHWYYCRFGNSHDNITRMNAVRRLILWLTPPAVVDIIEPLIMMLLVLTLKPVMFAALLTRTSPRTEVLGAEADEKRISTLLRIDPGLNESTRTPRKVLGNSAEYILVSSVFINVSRCW